VVSKLAYFKEIDILRAIAILGVLSIHVSAYFVYMKDITLLTFFYVSIDILSHFAVPLFVFISGFVLFNKYHDHMSYIKFCKSRIKTIILRSQQAESPRL